MNTQKNTTEQEQKQEGFKQEAIKIGIILFPGINCEKETKLVVDATGMEGEIIRWNTTIDPNNYAGYIIPGGWSYEDRIRAGVVSAKAKITDLLRKEAQQGKPILGICNGCQVLIESGIVPDVDLPTTESLKEQQKQSFPQTQMAIAPNINKNITGYYCTWVQVKLEQSCAFVNEDDKELILPLPIAHGEGRFTSNNDAIIKSVIQNKQIIMRYCDRKGNIINLFPTNPNGSFGNIAGLANKQGNVLAMMPHPERAFWKKQLPFKEAYLSYTELLGDGPGKLIFENMKEYIRKQRRRAR